MHVLYISVCIGNWTSPYHQCAIGLALEKHQIATSKLKHFAQRSMHDHKMYVLYFYLVWKTTSKPIKHFVKMHMWMMLHVQRIRVMLSTDFLFPRFLVFPPANPSNSSHCKCFSSRIPNINQYYSLSCMGQIANSIPAWQYIYSVSQHLVL